MQRAFNLVAIYELSLNVGVTLQVEVNSYMKENKVMNGLLFSVDGKLAKLGSFVQKRFYRNLFDFTLRLVPC